MKVMELLKNSVTTKIFYDVRSVSFDVKRERQVRNEDLGFEAAGAEHAGCVEMSRLRSI